MAEKQTLLVVDDDPIILNSVISILKDKCVVIPMTEGQRALDFMMRRTPDLVLLDYQLPDITGFDVLAKMREFGNMREIPVIFLTGLVDSDGEASALLMGAADYITKPIRPAVLETRVSIQLELERHRKKLEQLVAEKTRNLEEAYNLLKIREDKTLNLLARITDMRDEETGTHIIRTTAYVRIITEDLRKWPKKGYALSEDEAENIIKSSKLHDIGKIAVPDNILLKPGKLTAEEFDVIKKHPVYGKNFFDECINENDKDKFLFAAREISYSHHEKWDGSGYPQGLSGNAIPISGRIAALADVYDALTTERPYKKAFSHEKAAEIIREGSGNHFDPYIVEIFKRNEESFKEVSATAVK